MFGVNKGLISRNSFDVFELPIFPFGNELCNLNFPWSLVFHGFF